MKTVKMIALKPIRRIAVGQTFHASPEYARIWTASGHARVCADDAENSNPVRRGNRRAYKRRDMRAED